MSRSAFDRLVGYLARRDHSIRELRQKLSKYHEAEEVISALEKAQERGYLVDGNTLAERASAQLLRRGKGPAHIRAYLKKKGLPYLGVPESAELVRAARLVIDKMKKNPPYTLEEKKKIFRFLGSRGFSAGVARKVINSKGPIHEES